MTERFDVLVVGGGGAGYAAASTAARLGKRVAMAERWKLGGTCLNVGCVPTKALIRSAHVAETVRRAGEFGIDVSDWRVDYPRVVGRARAIIEGFSGQGPRESLARPVYVAWPATFDVRAETSDEAATSIWPWSSALYWSPIASGLNSRLFRP